MADEQAAGEAPDVATAGASGCEAAQGDEDKIALAEETKNKANELFKGR